MRIKTSTKIRLWLRRKKREFIAGVYIALLDHCITRSYKKPETYAEIYFEYAIDDIIIHSGKDIHLDGINKRGEDGWELVSVIKIDHRIETSCIRYYWKKLVEVEQKETAVIPPMYGRSEDTPF